MARSERPIPLPLFPSDFLGDPRVRAMSNTQIGIYMILLMTAWQENPPCTVSGDMTTLQRLTLCTPAEWRKLSPAVLACWEYTDGGRLINRRLEREYQFCIEGSKIASERGKKGADARWHKQCSSITTEHDTSNAQALLADGSPPHPIPIKQKPAAASAPAREDETPSARLSGIHLTRDQELGAAEIYRAAEDAMRPKGQAARGWIFPHHEAVNLSTFLDTLMAGHPALIGGKERYPWEREITAALIKTAFENRPASVKSLCKFIQAVWERCQRDGCMPGSPIVRTPLKVEVAAGNSKTSDADLEAILAAGKAGRRHETR